MHGKLPCLCVFMCKRHSHIYTHIRIIKTHMHTYVYIHKKRPSVRNFTYIHTYAHTHTYIHTCRHTDHRHTYIHAYIHAYIHGDKTSMKLRQIPFGASTHTHTQGFYAHKLTKLTSEHQNHHLWGSFVRSNKRNTHKHIHYQIYTYTHRYTSGRNIHRYRCI